MSRPDGEVVAPLPEGVVLEVSPGVPIRGGDEPNPDNLYVVEGRIESTLRVGGSEGFRAARIRALHETGQLDAYRERCEAAGWVRFDREDRATWPAVGEHVLALSQQHMFVATYDRDFEVWASVDARYGITRRSDTHWRPLPAGPVQP